MHVYLSCVRLRQCDVPQYTLNDGVLRKLDFRFDGSMRDRDVGQETERHKLEVWRSGQSLDEVFFSDIGDGGGVILPSRATKNFGRLVVDSIATRSFPVSLAS